jgi:hypothetical protein
MNASGPELQAVRFEYVILGENLKKGGLILDKMHETGATVYTGNTSTRSMCSGALSYQAMIQPVKILLMVQL